jgi:acyl-CoA synthetase (AMP-forming)/AMP-acid ligase II
MAHAGRLRDSRAKVLVVSAALYEKVAPILEGQPFLGKILVDGAAPAGTEELGAHLLAASPSLDAAPTTRDDVAFWLYTSGSTGSFKGAVHLLDEHGNVAPPGTVGDLWVSGPSSAPWYWNKRELSRATFHGPWTRTGD